MSKQAGPDKDNKGTGKLAAKLAVAAVAMFGFGFALVPLYDVLCDITGLNGKRGGRYEYDAKTVQVDENRLVTVQFSTSNNGGMSWAFHPQVNQVQVHPGELTGVTFFARNPGTTNMVAQAVPSVAPFEAADYLHKTECFCFSQQYLEGGESIDMPLMFFIDQDIPAEITKLTLSYTLFDVSANFVNASSSLTAN